jgi:hypothetical protein
MHSLLHISAHLDHPQGAYADPCQSYTFVELSAKYIVTSARHSIHTLQAETHVATTLQNS